MSLYEQLGQLQTEANELYTSSKHLEQQLGALKKLNDDLAQSNEALLKAVSKYKSIALAGVCIGVAGFVIAVLK